MLSDLVLDRAVLRGFCFEVLPPEARTRKEADWNPVTRTQMTHEVVVVPASRRLRAAVRRDGTNIVSREVIDKFSMETTIYEGGSREKTKMS